MPNKLSIITICYNESNLRATCESIVNQTWQDFEWIVVDGGSDKKTLDVFAQYKHRINHFISEKDNGIYNAMNKGIAAAKGEYINFLNAGDSYSNNKVLEKVVGGGLDKDVIFGDLALIKDGYCKNVRYPNRVDWAYLYVDSLPHQASFIKRELFVRYGNYDENYKIVSDWKKWLDFFVLNQCSYKHIDLICCNFDINGISGNQIELKRKEREAILHEYFSAEQLEEIKNKISFNTKELSYKEKIFSMKNSYDKKYKIINLLGLKLKIKRRAV